MTPEDSRSTLERYSAEKRQTLQQLVDAAVRAARSSGYCDQFEHVMSAVLPEFVITGRDRYGSRIHRAFDSDGLSCRGETLAQVSNGRSERDRARMVYGPDGYAADDDRDRDGFGRTGYDVSGYDADGWTSSSSRDGFFRTGYSINSVYREWETDGLPQPDAEQRTSGWDRRGRYVYLNADGQPRIGRAAGDAENAPPPVLYNPTTWAPEGETPIQGTTDYAVEDLLDSGEYGED